MNKIALYPVGTKLRVIKDCNPVVGGGNRFLRAGEEYTVIGHDGFGDPILNIPGADHGAWFFSKSISTWFNVLEVPEKAKGWVSGLLPPVGTVCRFVGDTSDGSDWHGELETGMEVTIVAHFDTGHATVAAFIFKHDGACQVEQAVASCFEPL